MKKITYGIIFILLFLGTSVFAVDMGLNFLFNYNLIQENGRLQVDLNTFSDIAYLGLFFDVPMTRNIGFRFGGAVKCPEIPPGEAVYSYNKNIHWDGSIGPSLHLFGKAAIDPYIQVGAGCAGAVFQDEETCCDDQTSTQIVIFIHGLAGINIVLADSFLVGLNIRVIPYSFNPSPLVTYKQFPVAGNLNVGFRF